MAPLANDKPLQIRVSEEFLAGIDDWRRRQPDVPARAEAIRRLVENALKADQTGDAGSIPVEELNASNDD